MTGDGAVDPELLRAALNIVNGAGPAVTEPALLARQELNRASQLMQDGRPGEAVVIFRQLATSPGGVRVAPAIGVEAAKSWASDAFQRQAWEEVIEAEQAATGHLDALGSRAGSLFSRDAASAERGRLAAMAAYASAKSGAIGAAMSILERGRTTMIAERFRVKRGPLRVNVPSRGQVIHLMATEAGGLALVSGKLEGASALWLEQLGTGAFRDRMRAYFSALDGLRRNSTLGMSAWKTEVAAMVGFLQNALQPLFTAFPIGPLTIIPVGFMSLLPITAAALGPDVPDRAITILPSLGLDPGQSASAPADCVLTIADPALPSAYWEDTGVKGFFSQSAAIAEMTASEILAAFPPGGVAHFSCHAELDIGAPLRSAIVLPGGSRLTVGDIFQAGPPPAAAVVLSACESGVPGPYLLDEAISLSTAFLAAGCKAVVSTLWLVEDLSTALVMLCFYWLWRHKHYRAPLALARAQHWLRTTSDLEKCRFVETDLVTAKAFTESDAAALLGRIQKRSASMTGNSYAEPYYWAGFYCTGRAA
jgi:hypothetical protein